jgi:predicted transglutaminase-like cysteine proteinase
MKTITTLIAIITLSTSCFAADVDKVHNEYKNIQYVTDQEQYGVADYWPTPAELKSRMKGDCEDVAISQYFDFLKAGYKDADLRIVAGTSTKNGQLQSHMILKVKDQYLDIQEDKVLKVKDHTTFKPLFSFNNSGVYLKISNEKVKSTLDNFEELKSRM